MRSGSLRNYIDIVKPPVDSGSRGGRDRTAAWITVYEAVPASIVDLSGLELIRAQRLQPEATIELRIRYHSGIDTTCRAIFGDRTFNFINIINVDQRNIEQIILASEAR